MFNKYWCDNIPQYATYTRHFYRMCAMLERPGVVCSLDKFHSDCEYLFRCKSRLHKNDLLARYCALSKILLRRGYGPEYFNVIMNCIELVNLTKCDFKKYVRKNDLKGGVIK